MPLPRSNAGTWRAPAPRRRQIIAGMAAAALLPAAARAEPAASLTRADWIALEKKLQDGRILLPGAQNYLALSTGYNAAYENKRPAGIVWCASAADVIAAVNWCRARGLAPKIRGGGHNYAGYSMTDGVMIATGGLVQGARLDANGTAWVPSGLLNRDVYKLLAARNLAITHGRCSTVGVAGFLLGGGIGFNMRHWGVGSDLMLGTDVVLADGRQVTATPDGPEQSLFWACTGGAGGNFGVNTGFRLKLMPAPELAVFHLQWGFTRGREHEVARALLRDLAGADPKFGCRFSLVARPRRTGPDSVAIDLLGQYAGPQDHVRRLLDGACARDTPIRYELKTVPYWTGQAFLGEDDTLDRFQERSLFVQGVPSDALLDGAFACLDDFPGFSDGTHADLRFFQTGGAMNRPGHDSAFVHRSADWLVDIGMSWSPGAEVDEVQACIAWQNGLFEGLWPHGTGGAFQNFPDPSLQDPQRAYYGAALARLSAVKKRYDPGNMFNYPQSVPVAPV